MISPIYQIIPLCYSDCWLIHEAIRLIPLRSGLSFKASTIVATSHLRMLSISSVSTVSCMVLYGLCGPFMTSGLPNLETWLGQTLRPRACNSFWILNQPILRCQPDANAMLSLDSFQQMSFLDILGLTFEPSYIYIYISSFFFGLNRNGSPTIHPGLPPGVLNSPSPCSANFWNPKQPRNAYIPRKATEQGLPLASAHSFYGFEGTSPNHQLQSVSLHLSKSNGENGRLHPKEAPQMSKQSQWHRQFGLQPFRALHLSHRMGWSPTRV
jgi:hypothetical protein